MPWSPSQFVQTFQLCVIGPTGIQTASLARKAAILEPSRFHPIVDGRAAYFQLLNQLRCQPFVRPEKLF
jgi:hypothetical protein